MPRPPCRGSKTYEPAAPMAEPTLPTVALALVPSAVIAIRQTTMIKASMTAYSTAVGPSSFFRNSTTSLVNRESMTFSFLPEFREQESLQDAKLQSWRLHRRRAKAKE